MSKSHVLPGNVTSPRKRWSLIAVLVDKGESNWALAIGRWDDEPVLAMRWNGTSEEPIGNPQSRGLSTWFIVPVDLYPFLFGMLPADKRTLIRNFFPGA